MKHLILTIGPPGSGKSTYAAQIAPLENGSYSNVSQDTLGKTAHYDYFKWNIEQCHNICVDRMNFNKVQRQKYVELARSNGYKITFVIFHVPYEECLNRCLERKDHPTIQNEENARAALHTFFTKYEKPEAGEADEVINLGWDAPHKHTAIVIDLDNTLSDATHREHFLQNGKKDWKGFFDAMGEDPVNYWCQELIYGLRNTVDILICSARPADYRETTIAWLKKHGIFYDKLIMRHEKDYRKDSVVKEMLYEFEIKPVANLLFWVDDRKQVIDQIRSHGIIVLDCAGEKGNF